MLFGVPDEITDMTRRVPDTYRVTERGFGHPRQRYGLNGPSKGTHQPTRGWCAPYRASHVGRKGKERRKRKV